LRTHFQTADLSQALELAKLSRICQNRSHGLSAFRSSPLVI